MNHQASLSFKHVQILVQRLGRRAIRRVLGEHRIDQEGQHHRDQGQAEHVAPAEGHRQAGREQGGQDRAGIAGAGDAQGRALVLGRIPARGQGQRHGEGRAGETQGHAQDHHLAEAVDARQPGPGQGGDDDALADPAGLLRPQVVHQHPHDHPQQRRRPAPAWPP
jgi:hypothetical protein